MMPFNHNSLLDSIGEIFQFAGVVSPGAGARCYPNDIVRDEQLGIHIASALCLWKFAI